MWSVVIVDVRGCNSSIRVQGSSSASVSVCWLHFTAQYSPTDWRPQACWSRLTHLWE